MSMKQLEYNLFEVQNQQHNKTKSQKAHSKESFLRKEVSNALNFIEFRN
jgi:hypothetical protein